MEEEAGAAPEEVGAVAEAEAAEPEPVAVALTLPEADPEAAAEEAAGAPVLEAVKVTP